MRLAMRFGCIVTTVILVVMIAMCSPFLAVYLRYRGHSWRKIGQAWWEATTEHAADAWEGR